MVVRKMKKWSRWPPSLTGVATTPRKFKVSLKPLKLEGLPETIHGDHKFVAIKIKWRGEPSFFPLMAPFQRNSRKKKKKEMSTDKPWEKIVRWEDDEDKWFENTCCFSVVSDDRHHKFGVWEIAFNVLYGEKKDSRAKTTVIGRVSINIAEMAAGEMDNSSVELKLPLNLEIDGFAGGEEATLTVLFNLVEIREPQESVTTSSTKSSPTDLSSNEHEEKRRRALSQEDIIMSLDDSDESTTTFDEAAKTRLSDNSRSLDVSAGDVVDSHKKSEGWFLWKNSRRFSLKRAKTKEDIKWDDKTESLGLDADPRCTLSSSPVESLKENNPAELEHQEPAGAWEEKELISRDGESKLKASVFFASFDQRSDKAAGESACTALVAVISHWLHSNIHTMPDRVQFDNLIIQGSSEWRRLCDDVTYAKDFPNKHFDLETVLRADIRPISIAHEKSFIGFFGAEAFESLKGVMSFDEIWDEISTADGFKPRIFIVSWNDHFFVLKAEANAYYIIDTLGERLFEGCNQAYMLRFDESSLMKKLADKDQPKTAAAASLQNEYNTEENGEEEERICRGKECCREFMKRFLAAIALKELEDEEKNKGVSYFSLHHRLQIEFNHSCLSSPHLPLTASPFSSIDASKFSPFFFH